MSLTTEHLPSIKEKKNNSFTVTVNISDKYINFYCECASVFVFILGPACDSLLHITISRKLWTLEEGELIQSLNFYSFHY